MPKYSRVYAAFAERRTAGSYRICFTAMAPMFADSDEVCIDLAIDADVC
jgi:hypothetical protein